MYFPAMALSSALATGTSSRKRRQNWLRTLRMTDIRLWRLALGSCAILLAFSAGWNATTLGQFLTTQTNILSDTAAAPDGTFLASRNANFRRDSRRQPSATIRYRGVAARGNSAGHQCFR